MCAEVYSDRGSDQVSPWCRVGDTIPGFMDRMNRMHGVGNEERLVKMKMKMMMVMVTVISVWISSGPKVLNESLGSVVANTESTSTHS